MPHTLLDVAGEVYLYRNRIVVTLTAPCSTSPPYLLHFVAGERVLQTFYLGRMVMTYNLELRYENVIGKASESFNRVSQRAQLAEGFLLESDGNSETVAIPRLRTHVLEELADYKARYWVLCLTVALLVLLAVAVAFFCRCRKSGKSYGFVMEQQHEQQIYEEFDLSTLPAANSRSLGDDFRSRLAPLRRSDTASNQTRSGVVAQPSTSYNRVDVILAEQVLCVSFY